MYKIIFIFSFLTFILPFFLFIILLSMLLVNFSFSVFLLHSFWFFHCFCTFVLARLPDPFLPLIFCLIQIKESIKTNPFLSLSSSHKVKGLTPVSL